MVRIEKGIPMPLKKPATGGGRKAKYPFGEMEVGDSILMAGVGGMTKKWRDALAPKTFENRSVVEGGKKRFRVWRTA